ncbi:MAG: hypothetical protein Q8P81_03770 [Nanoarchaeota archaeon]|nr:hypothetical protein [Nanoarchaeota archaeon]
MKKDKVSKENLLHIKFEYAEAIQSKRDFLSSQMSLLRIAKTMGEYNINRNRELEVKTSLGKKIKDIKTLINRLQKILPKQEIPEALKREQEEPEYKPKKKTDYGMSVEEQLKEIEERLHRLQVRS